MILDFFATEKYKLYEKRITPLGAGDNTEWYISKEIKAYIEPINGEKLLGTTLGKDEYSTLILYTKSLITIGQRVYINKPEKNINGWYEISQREFYKMPFFNYFKGYLVKTDENISI